MWPFKHQPSNRELLERLESVERRFKLLLNDVDDFFQSIRRAENRIKAKTAKLPDLPSEEVEAETPDTSTSNGSGPMRLTARQLEVQRQILRRRAGM